MYIIYCPILLTPPPVVFVVVYSVTSKSSLQEAQQIYEQCQRYGGGGSNSHRVHADTDIYAHKKCSLCVGVLCVGFAAFIE